MLRRPGEDLDWDESTEHVTHPHDELQPERELQNYFSPKRYYCTETICLPCGVVVAWTKFAKSESPTNILQFLEKVYPSKDSCPDYICIDKACMLLCTSLINGSWEEWKKTSHIIVDAYHYINHRLTDFLCRKWCNPAPLDGSAPNLVVVAKNKQGKKYLKRAFNTEACEQLNAWLGGYESILKKMTVANYNWFLHVLLYYHTKSILRKQELKELKKKKKDNGNSGDDSDKGDSDNADGDNDGY